jgi:hypothetical protein
MGLDPVTISLVAMGLSAAMAGYGAHSQGQAQKQSYRYQAQMDRYNQQIAEHQAKDAEAMGQQDRERLRERYAKLKGEGRANFAAGNIMLGSGTPQHWEDEADYLYSWDDAALRDNAAKDAWGFRTQGVAYGNQSRLSLLSGKHAGHAGGLGAGTSLLGGASSVSDRYIQYRS